MDNTHRRLSAAAWEMIEALAGLRRSVHQELDFIRSVSPDLPTNKMNRLLVDIDSLTADISGFLSGQEKMDPGEMEEAYREINDRFEVLNERGERFTGGK